MTEAIAHGKDRPDHLCSAVIPVLDEKEIHEGDIMGIGDHGILAVGKGRTNVARRYGCCDGYRGCRSDQYLLMVRMCSEEEAEKLGRRAGSSISGL